MDLDQIQNLTNEQKDAYLKMERLFDSPGWGIVEKFAKERHEVATNRLLHAKSWDENRIFTGARDAIELFVNLRENTEAEFVQLAAANLANKLSTEEDENE